MIYKRQDCSTQRTTTSMQPDLRLQQILSGNSVLLEQLFQPISGSNSTSGNEEQALRHATAEKFCSFLFKKDQFDLSLNEQLNQLQNALVEQVAKDSDFYCNSTHPLREGLQLLLTRGRTWYPRESKSSQQFFEQLSHLIAACKVNEAKQLTTAIHDFKQWLDSEEKRATLVETRLCETEINHFKLERAECHVIDFLNSHIANRYFPQVVSQGFITALKSELLHSYFVLGHNSPFWNTWQKILPTLTKIFSTVASTDLTDNDEQTLYRTIPALLNELERSLHLHTSNPHGYKDWLELLCEQLILAIRKQPILCVRCEPLKYPDAQANANTRVTNDLLQQTKSIEQDDWILFSGEHKQVIRCKLALKNVDMDLFLFVDSTGRKVMSKCIKDFALCISTGIAKKLPHVKVKDAIGKTIISLIEMQKQNGKHDSSLLEESLSVTHPEVALPSVKNRQDIHQNGDDTDRLARQAAAEKALSEAAVILEEQKSRELENRLAQERERIRLETEQAAEYMQKIQLANIHISALNLGARVELRIKGELNACKLAVIIAATGKYIFTDNLGRKVAELQREQLVQMVMDSELTLLNNGNSFDDQLGKVIRSLRKDIS